MWETFMAEILELDLTFPAMYAHLYDMAGFWGEVWGGAHLPWDRFAPPLRIFAMIDQSENLTFFGCIGYTLRKKVFL